jgi:hypothetical protein
VNTYDPADSIVYVHMALESAGTRSRPTAGEAEVFPLPTGGTVSTDHDWPYPASGRSSDQIS